MNLKIGQLTLLIVLGFCFIGAGCAETIPESKTEISKLKIDQTVNSVIEPLMQEHDIPGMAVALSIDGKDYFYNYGVASKATKSPVTKNTIFEIGSISKTFTASLASYAQEKGKLSFNDSVSHYLPDLKGSSFDKITLLDLGVHTSGGLPLQVPDEVTNNTQLMSYYKNWEPSYPAGTHRSYSNPSIGLLGVVTATALKQPFAEVMEKDLFVKLGLSNTYINVPPQKMQDYAQGYNKENKLVRVNPGVLDSEAYGVKSSSSDMIKFLKENMGQIPLEPSLQNAIHNTQFGYYQVGDMTQMLIWEEYQLPSTLNQLLAGNSYEMIYEANKVKKLSSPLAPQKNVWINKTGATGGFGGYVVFIPAKNIGVVLLANRNYPNEARVAAVYQILKELGLIQ